MGMGGIGGYWGVLDNDTDFSLQVFETKIREYLFILLNAFNSNVNDTNFFYFKCKQASKFSSILYLYLCVCVFNFHT